MPENPDFIPSSDGVGNLGLPNRPWDTIYVDKISNGTVEIPIARLVTLDNYTMAPGRPLPNPVTGIDEGKMLIARNGEWVMEEYPRGTLPPITPEHEGMVMQVIHGKWTLRDAMVLPPVDATMDGAMLRVVGGKFIVWNYNFNPGDNPWPTPVAPVTDGMTLVSRGGFWKTEAITEKISIPAIGPNDLGKYITVQKDEEASAAAGTTLYGLKYTRPPLVTATAQGALPPLPGDYKQFFNGSGSWSAVSVGNNGHWRVGDMKLSVAPTSPGFLPCQGKTIGRTGSGADFTGNAYRMLFAILHGATDWETAWNNNSVKTLPNREYYQIRFSPDGQAPAEASILFDAFAGSPSFFQVQTCRRADFTTAITYFNSYPSPAGFYRLGGNLPELLSAAGDNFTDEESILFDITGYFTLTAGLHYYRARQLVGNTTTPTVTGRWKYGSFITTSA